MVENLVVLDDRHQIAVDGVNFDVRAGEVLGVAGVQGNGQTELVQALTGLNKPQSGRASLLDQEITFSNTSTDNRDWGPPMFLKIAKKMG